MKIPKFVKDNIFLLLYLVLAVFTFRPFLSHGFFSMHDDTQVARIFEMGKSLSHGMFPVRWVEDLGYGAGYPIFNFYSVLPYYIGGALTNIGIEALTATKIVFILVLIGSGISMYLLVREIFGKLAGFTSSIIYLYFPYHAVNVYVRGDLSEATAYAFLPLVFLSLFKIHKQDQSPKKHVVLGSFSMAAVVVSHNLSFFMLGIFMAVFIILSLVITKKRKYLFFNYSATLILAFLLSAFYSVPAILEMGYTNIASIIGGGSDWRNHFVCAYQLWNSPWGFGGSAPGCVDGMSFKLGKLNVLLSIIAFLLFVINFGKIKNKFFLMFSFFALIFSIFITLEYSSIIWRLPLMDFLQFPWRFLNFTGLFISVAVGYLIWQIGKNYRYPLGVKPIHLEGVLALFVILLTLIYNAPLFNPKTIHDRGNDFYTNERYLKWTVSRISDEYLPKNFTKPSQEENLRDSPFDIVDGDGKLEVLINKTQENKVKVSLLENGTIRANITYFPAWKLFVNNVESSYIIKGDGLYINLPRGEYIVSAKFVQTTVERFSNMLSIIGFLGIIIVIIPYGKKTSRAFHLFSFLERGREH